MKTNRPDRHPPRPLREPARRTDRDDPLPEKARERRAYTDFLSLCLYPGMPRRTEAILPGVGESAA
jgi:hypothetical protein